MAILAAYAVPHPPLAVPAIGRGREGEIQPTMDAYRQMAEEVCALAPETVVVSSPHAPLYRDYMQVSSGEGARGSFAQFGVPRPVYEVAYDTELVRALDRACADEGVDGGTEGRQTGELDHGVMVPLHFIQEAYGEAAPGPIGRSQLVLAAKPRDTRRAAGRKNGGCAASSGR